MKRLVINITFIAVLALMVGACGGKEGEKATEDSAKADSVGTEQVADPAAVQAEASAAAEAEAELKAKEESEAFAKVVPNPKRLSWGGYADGSSAKYLKSLGYKSAGHDKWKITKGDKTCTVSIKFVDSATDGPGMYFTVTITGDEEALNAYYKKAKKSHGSYASKKGNTVTTKEFAE